MYRDSLVLLNALYINVDRVFGCAEYIIHYFTANVSQCWMHCTVMYGDCLTMLSTLYINEPSVILWSHYSDVIMSTIASLINSLTIVYSTVYSDTDQRKHQSPVSLAFVRGIQRRPVNSPHKWPVTRKMFPFDDVIMRRKCVVHVRTWIVWPCRRHCTLCTMSVWFRFAQSSVCLCAVIEELYYHDDVIKWKHFPRYWPLVRGIRWIPLTKASDAGFSCFLWSAPE